jgi:two-component system, NtrC family, sensor histidine kinase KinB
MTPPPLRQRVRNGTLAMLAIALFLGALALPEIHRLGGAIRETLYRNYTSIEAAQHMHHALWTLELSQRDGTLASVLPANRDEFLHWIIVEANDITEVGEADLARDIEERGRKLIAELGANSPSARYDAEFAALHLRLDRLVKINRDAMFKADSRSARMGDRLTYEFAAGLALLLLLGAAVSWTLGLAISKPLSELAERLRSFSLRGPSLRLGEQPLAELQGVASEFNRMADRLEQFEKLNLDRLIYEKSKTEAIIESLEDGILLIDPDGIITHLNEVAAIILGVERAEALGSRFDDLNSNHPHYRPADAQRAEVDLHVRGRDHSYVLKQVPLRQSEGQSFGTILILQDVTYLRDQDRARANLVATLSHELKTPLTSLALAAQLLERDDDLDRSQRELVTSLSEDIDRLRRLADDLLQLSRNKGSAIAIRTIYVDLNQLLRGVARTFTIQAEQKHIDLELKCERPEMNARVDPVKFSWVVSNLLANALRYTPDGGKITLECGCDAGLLRLKVHDTGKGIPAELRDHLFERFAQWQINGAPPGSAGLGLAIAKEIVEAHGGRIFVDSVVGEGTSFTVELPGGPENSWQVS